MRSKFMMDYNLDPSSKSKLNDKFSNGCNSNPIGVYEDKHMEDGKLIVQAQHYAYFKTLKWSGLFPYDLKVQEVNGRGKESHVAESAWCSNSGVKGDQTPPKLTTKSRILLERADWAWRVLHHTVFFMYIFFNAFVYTQLLRRLAMGNEDIVEEMERRYPSWSLPLLPLVYKLSIFSWALRLNSSFVIFFMFWRRKEAIRDLILRWYEVGGRIRSAASRRGRDRAQRRPTISWPIGILILGFWLTFLFGFGANQYLFPRHAIYIYSLVPRPTEVVWLRVLSFVTNQLLSWFTLVHTTGFAVFAAVLPEAVTSLLQLAEPESEILARPAAAAKLSLSQALATYDELRLLTDDFNKHFASHLMYLKSTWLLTICVLVYIPLYFSVSVPFIGLIVFIPGAASVAVDVYLILTRMGAVYAESKEFKAAWGKASLAPEYLRTRSPIERYENKYARARLQLLAPIQFWFGTFYTARPSTALTFFSVVTTYLIFLLQIRGASN